MAQRHHKLIDLWRSCRFDSPPFVLPQDRLEIDRSGHLSEYHSFDEYVASRAFGREVDANLHVGLLPVPYIGNLQRASIFVLMLNPGLTPGSYFAEQHSPEFRQALIKTLRQENAKDEYPFIFLDPRFAWLPGGEYWQKKFHSITAEIVKRTGISTQEALGQLSQNLACLEFFPYHSKNFGVARLRKRLTSVQAVVGYVHDVLIPRAQRDEITIIAARGVKHWGLPKHKKNIVLYEGAETRSAHLTLNSRKAIARRLGL